MFVHVLAHSNEVIVDGLLVIGAMVAMLATLQTDDATPSATSLVHVNLDHVIVRTVVRIGGVSTARPYPLTTERDHFSRPLSGAMHTHNILDNTIVPHLCAHSTRPLDVGLYLVLAS